LSIVQEPVSLRRSRNLAAIAVAGPDRVARPGESLELDGSYSREPGGAVVGCAWEFGPGSIGLFTLGAWVMEGHVRNSGGTDPVMIGFTDTVPGEYELLWFNARSGLVPLMQTGGATHIG
jgi:hypothetical protein